MVNHLPHGNLQDREDDKAEEFETYGVKVLKSRSTGIITITNSGNDSADPVDWEDVELPLCIAFKVIVSNLPRVIARLITDKVWATNPDPYDG